MTGLRRAHRLQLIALLPLAVLAVLALLHRLIAGHAPGTAALLAGAAIAAAAGALLAHRTERSLSNRQQRLLDGVRDMRAGDHGHGLTRSDDPDIEPVARELDALAEEIRRNRRSLEQRIGESTAELQDTLAELEARNEELEAARCEAEAASEFKSRFLANISHEIRTPMNSILGFTELLDDRALDPVQLDYLATIRSSAHGLLSLLNGILDLSKIESGRMELEPSDVDVNELLFEAYHLFAPQAFAKGVELIVSPAPASEAWVRLDPTRLKQVLINLASNAVKFTDSGHVRLGIDAAARADGGVALTFSFADTGRGIPPDAQSRLFQAFAQGEQTRADMQLRPAGTGLGLHIASEIVFLMDGLIEFTSEPGSGSEFWFHLEAERALHRPAPPSRVAADRRALLVAADSATGAAESRLLQHAGIAAEVCGDVEAALARLASPAHAAPEAVLVHLAPADTPAADHPPVDERLRATGLRICAHAYLQSADRRRALLDAGYDEVIDRIPEPARLREAFERAVDGVVAEPGPTRPAPDAPDAPDAPEADERGARLDVLLVDDQPLNLKLLERYLEGTPYRAFTAQGSDEALYEARLHRFDAILLDIHLPERDGIETTRLLRRAGETNADTPIIAVTADAFAERAGQALSAGMNDVLVKPVGRHELLTRLAEWCPTAEPIPPGRDPAEPGHAARADDGGAPPLYDPDDAAHRAGGREEVAAELFDMLRRHLPESREELRGAAAADDRARMHAAAHRLKGAAAYCGVPQLRADLDHLERALSTDADAESPLLRTLETIDRLERLEACPTTVVATGEPGT